MNEAENAIAQTIIYRIALAIIQGEENPRQELLVRYGEFGFELAERYLLDKMKAE